MAKAFPWVFKGMDQETQDAARAAARRSGKSLDDWLDEVIQQKAAAELRANAVDEEDEDERPEPTSRRFSRLRGAARLSRDRGRWRKEPSARVQEETNDAGREVFEERTRPPHRDDAGLNAKTIVDDAVAQFERRAAESERKTAKALAGLADLIENRRPTRSRPGDDLGAVIERLGRIEKQLSGPPEGASARPVRRASEQTEPLSREHRATEFETALQALDRRLAELAERLDRGGDERPAARPAPAVRGASEQERRQAAPSRRPLADAIAEITQRQRALEEQSDGEGRVSDPFAEDSRGERQSAVARQIEELRQEIEGVSRALVDLAPRASIGAVETALHELAERVEAQRSFGVRDNVLAPVERLTADLQAIIRDLDSGRIVHNLYDEVKTIGDRLAAQPVDGGADQGALTELAEQTREMRDLLKFIASRPLPLEKLEAGLNTLTTRVDELSLAGQSVAGAKDVGELVRAIRSIIATETSGAFDTLEKRIEGLAAKLDAVLAKSGGKRFDEINERLDRVHKSLAARIDRGAASVDTNQLEQLVSKLAKKIDSALDPKAVHSGFDELGRKIDRLEERLPPRGGAETPEAFRELAQRIDFVHSELAARIEDGVRARADGATEQLAELVGQLAEKMDAALDPRADRAAFSSLEQQIERLSERLDRSDENVASFASIERTIGQLFDRIEETRDSTARAAELAAREAAQDVLREATAPGALQSAIEKELAELRGFQDQSGHRTHQTLSAVHETLERVVDRLAVFEEELDDLRNTPPSAPKGRQSERLQAARESKIAAAAPELEDELLEPGSRRGKAPGKDRKSETIRLDDLRGDRSVQADFIAAARRAAQQAAADAQAAAQVRNGRKAAAERTAEREFEEPARKEAAGGFGTALQARKRPLLLGLGALVLLVGAYQIARVSIEPPAPPVAPTVRGEPSDAPAQPAPQTQSEAAAGAPTAKAPARATSGASESNAAPSAPPQGTTSPPPVAKLPALSAPPTGLGFTPPPAASAGKPIEGVDTTPVGAIGSAGSNPAAAARPDVISAIRGLAAGGDPGAQFELGVRYIEGNGLPRDAKAGFQWFEKAAAQGLAPAQYRLGSLYEKGIGVDRDYARARDWYLRAAQAGNARAMHNLAVLYAEGGEGKPDYVSAATWFRKAAEYGVRDSQYNFAILCARGLGVPQSLTQSYLWFSAAAAQGDDDAAKKRDEVAARLEAKELPAAKALAEGFHPKQPEKAANDVPPPQGGWENVKAPAKPETKPAKPKVSAL